MCRCDDKAIASGDYDAEIRDKAARGITGEELFFDLAITDGVDGWVSLFSADHYRAAAEAYLRGIERRIAAGLSPRVGSVAEEGIVNQDEQP